MSDLSQQQIRVLHVDDNPEITELTAAFLQREDNRISVETATDAHEGLQLLSESEIDCIVSDYEMSRTNGIEFLDSATKNYPNISFILYTGKGSEEVASEAISAGVTDYLQKESGTDEYALLANRIVHAVESKQRERRIRFFKERSNASQYYCQRKGRRIKTVKATTLTDTESLAVLDVHCCIKHEHDTKAGPRVVRRNADDLRAVAADNGFQDWHTEYEIAVLDVDYLIQYRGSTPKAAATNALTREKG